MTSNHISARTRDYSNLPTIDRLALSRSQHLNRPKSVSDDEVDTISDWSDSDQECCPLSDFESNIDEDNNNNNNKTKLLPEISHSNILHIIETSLPIIDDSTTSTQTSFTSENEKSKQEINKKFSINSIQSRKQSQTPLLPARRIQLPNTSRYPKTIIPIHRESITVIPHLTKDSSTSSLHNHDDNQNQRQTISPNLSQTSVPRVYEIKKIFVDDCDYGRLTDLSSIRLPRPSSRQKWGTIVHPPFPLGYQHIPPEQVTQTVERLSSSVRCRDRHTPIQIPSKRYLSIEETEALINRLSKVKTIRSPDQYWPIQRQSRSIKTFNNNWKTIGISA